MCHLNPVDRNPVRYNPMESAFERILRYDIVFLCCVVSAFANDIRLGVKFSASLRQSVSRSGSSLCFELLRTLPAHVLLSLNLKP